MKVTFKHLIDSGLKVNVSKCNFFATEVDYLSYTLTRDGIKPQTKTGEAIQRLLAPHTVRDVRSILGIIQYYRDTWPHRSHTLVPISELISTSNLTDEASKKDKLCPVKWNSTCQKAFDEIK